MTINTLRKVK